MTLVGPLENISLLKRLKVFLIGSAGMFVLAVFIALFSKVELTVDVLLLLFAVILSTVVYHSFAIRFHVTSIRVEGDNVIIQFSKWFRPIETVIWKLEDLEVKVVVKYHRDFTVLVISNLRKGEKINQSPFKGYWDEELMRQVRDELLIEKKRIEKPKTKYVLD